MGPGDRDSRPCLKSARAPHEPSHCPSRQHRKGRGFGDLRDDRGGPVPLYKFFFSEVWIGGEPGCSGRIVCEGGGTDSHGSHRRRRVPCPSHRHITQICFCHFYGQLAASRWRDRRGSHLTGRQLDLTSRYLCIPLNGDRSSNHVRDRWDCVIFHHPGARLSPAAAFLVHLQRA